MFLGELEYELAKVFWFDETKMEIFGLVTKCYIWQKTKTAPHPENAISTMKHGGGSIML